MVAVQKWGVPEFFYLYWFFLFPTEVQRAPNLSKFADPNSRRGHADEMIHVNREDGARKSPSDEYFCKGMDMSGPESWERLLQQMEGSHLENAGGVNQQAGIR